MNEEQVKTNDQILIDTIVEKSKEPNSGIGKGISCDDYMQETLKEVIALGQDKE